MKEQSLDTLPYFFHLNENKSMIMNKLLIDYCISRLADSNYKLEYKEVTNASFAKFIENVAECIDDLRECDLLLSA